MQHVRHGRKGETILDLIRGQKKRLHEYKSPTATAPELRYGMDAVLSEFKEGSWQYAVVKTAAEIAKKDNDYKIEKYEEAKRMANLEGVQMKQTAIDSAVA